jgi:hypothetical protein
VQFRAGQTFLYPLNDESQREHLWINRHGTECRSDFRYGQLYLTPGRKGPNGNPHEGGASVSEMGVVGPFQMDPLPKWDTCISYALAEIVTAEKLQTYLEQGRAKMHVPLLRRYFD